jgi:hypothetical protein
MVTVNQPLRFDSFGWASPCLLLDSRRYRRLSTLDLNRASEAAAFATMGVWRLVVATVPLHPRFGADQKQKRSCSLKNRSPHRVTAFGVRPHVAIMRKLLHIAFGVLKYQKPFNLYSFLFLKPFDSQDRIYQGTARAWAVPRSAGPPGRQ